MRLGRQSVFLVIIRANNPSEVFACDAWHSWVSVLVDRRVTRKAFRLFCTFFGADYFTEF
jgi:hypothetical protein